MSKADEEYYFKLGKRLALKDYQIRQDANEIKELKALILEAIYFAKLSGLGQEWLVANKEKLKELEGE